MDSLHHCFRSTNMFFMPSSNRKNVTVPVDFHRDLIKPYKDGSNRLCSRAIFWRILLCILIFASAFFSASVLQSVYRKEESRLYAINVARRERGRPLWASLELPQDENGQIIEAKMVKPDPIQAKLEDTDNRNDQHPVIMARLSELLKDDQQHQEGIEKKLRSNLGIIGKVEGVVAFPDNVLLLLVKILFSVVEKFSVENYECVYENIGSVKGQVIILPIIRIDQKEEGGNDYFVRCLQINIEEEELIFGNNNLSNSYITLRRKGQTSGEYPIFSKMRYSDMLSWKTLIYESVSLQNSVLLFVKGGNRSFRPRKVEEYPRGLECVYGGKVRTEVLMVAQEVVHCKKPPLELEESLKGETITLWDRRRSIHYPSISHFEPSYSGIKPTTPIDMIPLMSSMNYSRKSSTTNETPYKNRREKMTMMKETKKKYFLCLCSMIWNQAQFLPEWIIYHSALGVERWFLYDNNSDDSTEAVIQELRKKGIKITRHSWPWIKTQEAGFSHCVLRAKPECEWMLFIDVDEFVYPKHYINGSINSYIDGYVNPVGSNLGEMLPGIIMDRRTRKSTHHPWSSLEGTVNSVIEYLSMGEIRIKCHNFGPSRLSKIPEVGVSVGYNCRMRRPERHKSIVRLDAIHPSLLNVVHHFLLKPGYTYTVVQWPEVVINHYKYQVWDVFKQKFVRRVSSYVADWGETQNMGSGDRTPGLGTEPVEPWNWANRFCQLHDNGLKEFVLSRFSNPHTSWLPWTYQ